MQKRVTFHKHEIEGAKILKSRLTKLGFSSEDIKIPKAFVELHQVRFHQNTHEKTLRAFIRKLGKDSISAFFLVLQADRAGNRTKHNKPLITYYMRNLQLKLTELARTTILEEDLCLKINDLIKMGLSIQQANHAIKNMTAIVQLKPHKNNLKFLIEFANKNYLEKK
jgi:hypothetical protein